MGADLPPPTHPARAWGGGAAEIAMLPDLGGVLDMPVDLWTALGGSVLTGGGGGLGAWWFLKARLEAMERDTAEAHESARKAHARVDAVISDQHALQIQNLTRFASNEDVKLSEGRILARLDELRTDIRELMAERRNQGRGA